MRLFCFFLSELIIIHRSIYWKDIYSTLIKYRDKTRVDGNDPIWIKCLFQKTYINKYFIFLITNPNLPL